ncbi:MAG: enoyl-CoA hydratase-related protein [Dehalococcoidia bacterium]
MADCELDKRADGIALITLNRPERLNALGGDLLRLLGGYLLDCERDPAVRCVVLTGAGRAFCAGGDVQEMQRRNDGVTDTAGTPANAIEFLDTQVRMLRETQLAVSHRLHTMGKPTVAVVNGVAVGAGFSLALACDLRLVGDKARFGTAFRNVGLSGDYGASYYLPRVIGAGRARELFFTAEILDAERALELGIANRVFPQDTLLENSLAFCATLAAGPTLAFKRMKENLNLAERATLEDVLNLEALNQRVGGMTADSREAVLAFNEKRQPNFRGA